MAGTSKGITHSGAFGTRDAASAIAVIPESIFADNEAVGLSNDFLDTVYSSRT
jgi:hypothetical protein